MFWIIFIWLYVLPIIICVAAILYDVYYGEDSWTWKDLIQLFSIILIPGVAIAGIIGFVWKKLSVHLDKPIKKAKK